MYHLPGLSVAENIINSYQPFSAPTVIPAVKYRWNKRNTTNIGTHATVAPAILYAKFGLISCIKLAVPTIKVLMLFVLAMSICQR